MSKTLGKLLERFRKVEDRSALATVLDSPECLRVLAAWPSVRVQWSKPKGKQPKDPDRLWAWVWLGLTFDLDQLARGSRLSSRSAYAQLRALYTMRLVYPDGTVSEGARTMLEQLVEQKLQPSRPGPAPREPAKPGQKPRPIDPGGPISKACPLCDAQPGARCTRPNGESYFGKSKFHAARRKAKQ